VRSRRSSHLPFRPVAEREHGRGPVRFGACRTAPTVSAPKVIELDDDAEARAHGAGVAEDDERVQAVVTGPRSRLNSFGRSVGKPLLNFTIGRFASRPLSAAAIGCRPRTTS